MGQKLYVHNDVSLNKNVEIAETLYVEGDVSLNKNVEITNNLYVHDNTFIDKDVSMGMSLNVDGDASFNTNVEIKDNLYVHEKSFFDKDVSMGMNLIVEGDTTINNIAEVKDNFYVREKTFLDNDVSMGANLEVNGDVSFNRSLDVEHSVVVHRHVFVDKDVSMGENLYVSGNSTLSTVDISGKLNVNGDVSLNNNLEVFGRTDFRNDTYFANSGTGSTVTFQSDKLKFLGNDISFINTEIDFNGSTHINNRPNFPNDPLFAITTDSIKVDLIKSGRYEYIDEASGSVFTKIRVMDREDVSGAEDVSGFAIFDVNMFSLRKTELKNEVYIGDETQISDPAVLNSDTNLDQTKLDIYASSGHNGIIYDGNVSIGNHNPGNTDNGSTTLNVYGDVNIKREGELDVNGSVHIVKDLVVDGSFVVSGETTFINTTNMDICDNIVILNALETQRDSGILIKRPGTGVKNAFIGYDEPENGFVLGFTDYEGTQQNVDPLSGEAFHDLTNLDFTSNEAKLTVGKLGIGETVSNASTDKLYVKGSATFDDPIKAGYDENTTSYFGKAAIGKKTYDWWASFFHINATTSAIRQNSAGQTVINCDNGQKIDFCINNSSQMRLMANGNFGIGTTSPMTKLQINTENVHYANNLETSALSIVNTTPTSSTALNDPKPCLYLFRNGTSLQSWGAAASFCLSRYENPGSYDRRSRLDINLGHGGGNNADTTGEVNNNSIMTMLSNGNVGIGLSPVSKLDVNGSIQVRNGNAGAVGIKEQLTLSNNDTYRHYIGTTHVDTSAEGSRMDFYCYAGTNVSSNTIDSVNTKHVLTLNGAGQVGICTTTPSCTLDISSTDAIKLPVGTDGERPGTEETGMIRYNTTTSQFEGYSNSNWQGLGGVIDVDQDTKIIAESNPGDDNDELQFYTVSKERMRINNGIEMYYPLTIQKDPLKFKYIWLRADDVFQIHELECYVGNINIASSSASASAIYTDKDDINSTGTISHSGNYSPGAGIDNSVNEYGIWPTGSPHYSYLVTLDTEHNYNDLQRIIVYNNGNSSYDQNYRNVIDIQLLDEDKKMIKKIVNPYTGASATNYDGIQYINYKGPSDSTFTTPNFTSDNLDFTWGEIYALDISGGGINVNGGGLSVTGGDLRIDPGSGERNTCILAKGSDKDFKLVAIQDNEHGNEGKIAGIGVKYRPDSNNYDVGSIRFLRGGAGGAGYITFSSNNTELMRIKGSNGYVGIGTNDPATKLDVKGNAGEVLQTWTYGSSNRTLKLTAPASTAPDSDNPWVWATDNAFDFQVDSVSELYIKADGNVGIGTNNPGKKLDVNGDGRFSTTLDVGGLLTATGGSKIVVQGGTDGGTNRGIYMWTNTNTDWGIYMASGSGSSLAGGSAVSGYDGITGSAIRFRAWKNSGAGFIFENGDEELLHSINSSTGDGYFKGTVTAGGAGFFGSGANLTNLPNASQWEDGTSNEIYYDKTGGNVGIGTTDPNHILHVEGSSVLFKLGDRHINFGYDNLSRNSVSYHMTHIDLLWSNSKGYRIRGGIKQGSSEAYFIIDKVTASNETSEKFRIDDDGNVGIGTNNPSTKLHVNGTVTATNFVSTSDRNLKENIVALEKESVLEKVSKLNGYQFNFKSDETKKTKSGLIAQEVEEVMPELVMTNETNQTKTMDYSGMIPYLVECIKVQKTQIETQQEQINMLKEKIENM